MDRPWFQEDNRVSFIADGLQCYMCRGSLGAWCGYAGVSQFHPWFGKSYSETVKPTAEMLTNRHDLDHNPIDMLCMMLSSNKPSEALPISMCVHVHGGLTYSENHKPYGKPDGLWWFGFDCAHCDDLIPGLNTDHHMQHQIYRDQSYVVAECQSLAAQLAKVTI